uniref:Very-long-chain (3R)-3-hydroxyacyl-CoA dehydratase n=1 Tax=Phallusia mammillata TaxID=59560 RepID=A0A6F9DDL7_9ASCI|nr:very-long-chain (3R)-3-hydroxyacyl-CoA dehydratase 3-like [Phallusia mammillata]
MEPGSDFEEITVLHPNVLWAQRKEIISLKVSVGDVQKPKISLTEKSLTFEAEGLGAKGWNIYKFTLDFYDEIDKEGCVYKVTPTCVDLQLTKQGEGNYWPRLIPENTKKPHFLKLDFERWRSESDDELEVKQKQAESGLELNQPTKEEEIADYVQNFYLTMYNFAQFVLYSIVFIGCLYYRLKLGPDFYADTYATYGSTVIFAVLLAYLEALHGVLGIVKSPWYLTFMQVSGRTFAFFCMWLVGPEHLPRCAVWDLFVVWSCIEVIRYPYYMLQTYNMDLKPLTWLRYHAWILLYPIGGFSEYSVITSAARRFSEESMYALTLPNPLNFSLSLSAFLHVYVVFLFVGIMGLMRHLWKMRQRKYGNRRKFKPA